MQAGRLYRWRLVQASTMKWMDLSLNGSGCHWGIYSRDGNFLRSFPRMTDHIAMSAANRCVPESSPSCGVMRLVACCCSVDITSSAWQLWPQHDEQSNGFRMLSHAGSHLCSLLRGILGGRLSS